jgi:hypothetical protein
MCYIGPQQGRLPEAPQLDGLIGLGILDQYVLTIDAPAGKLGLALGEAATTLDASHTVPFTRTKEGIVTHGSSARGSLKLIWDTGASHSVIRPRSSPGAPSRTESGYTIIMLTDVRVATGALGDIEFVVLDFSHPRVDGILGMNYFANHAVRIDFSAERLEIQSTSTR